MQIKDKEFEIYLTSQVIQDRIKGLADQINIDYQGKRPLMIAVLNGAFMFAADLMKSLNGEVEISFVKIASYQATQSTGKLDHLLGLQEDVKDRDIILIEDIVDTGLTMSELITNILAQKPASLAVATLLWKKEALQKPMKLQYVGFEIPNKFVVGYGLDYDGLGRNLADIYQLKE